jgi:hypothetical protein
VVIKFDGNSCLRDIDFEDMIILKWTLKKWYKCVKETNLLHDWFPYQALRVSYKAWNSSIRWTTANFWRKCSWSVLNHYLSILLHCLWHIMSHPIRAVCDRSEVEPHIPTVAHRVCISVPTDAVETLLHGGLSILLLISSSSSSSFHFLGSIACHSLMLGTVWSSHSPLSSLLLIHNLKWD